MALSDVLTRVVGFLRAGYPEGVPAHDYIPLLALLRRRLSDDEVMAVAAELTSDGSMTPVAAADMGGRHHQADRRDAVAGRHRAS